MKNIVDNPGHINKRTSANQYLRHYLKFDVILVLFQPSAIFLSFD